MRTNGIVDNGRFCTWPGSDPASRRRPRSAERERSSGADAAKPGIMRADGKLLIGISQEPRLRPVSLARGRLTQPSQ